MAKPIEIESSEVRAFIKAVKEGKVSGFEEIQETLYGEIHRVSETRVRHYDLEERVDAADMAAAVFVAIIARIEKSKKSKLKTARDRAEFFDLCRWATRAYIDREARSIKENDERFGGDLETIESDERPDEDLEIESRIQEIVSVVEPLGEFATIFLQERIAKHSHKDIQEKLGVPRTTYQNWVYRLREAHKVVRKIASKG